jgi:hypothetical protein
LAKSCHARSFATKHRATVYNMRSSSSLPRKTASVLTSRCKVYLSMTTAFMSTSHRVYRSSPPIGVKIQRATQLVAEEDSAASTAWNAESSTVEKREAAREAKNTTTCSTKRSAKGVVSPKKLGTSPVAGVRLDETMLEVAGLRERKAIGTGMSLRGVVMMIATIVDAGVLNVAGVATGMRGGDSAVTLHHCSVSMKALDEIRRSVAKITNLSGDARASLDTCEWELGSLSCFH